MENNNNKKTLILSIIGILVLVIAVVGVSFAMYKFSGIGTKTNVIKTGTVNMSFDPNNNFVVTNKYPMTDAQGIAQTDSKATFGVKGEWGDSLMTIDYDLGITNITAGDSLTEEFIKVALLDSTGKVIVGTTDESGNLTGGVTIASLASTPGANNLITSYGLTGGSITNEHNSDNYTILAYVSDQYDLQPDTDATKTIENVKKTTKSETFSFEVGIKAAQK